MSFYFFSDISNLNIQGSNAFGPASNQIIDSIEYEQFLTTSKHTASDNIDAIATCNGQILVQEQSLDPNLLNIVFKPSETSLFNFPKVKYFIYKGIKKDSLVAQDNISLVEKGSNDLVDSIWKSFEIFNKTGGPSKLILGLHPAIEELADDTPVEDVFLSVFPDVQFWYVKGGDTIGKFEQSSIGFEIILDTLFYKPTLKLARNTETYISVKILNINPLQKDFFDHWHDKEQVLNFIDPCAFYSAFYNNNLNVIDGVETQVWKSEDLFTNLILKFLNKDKCYIDIKNEFNFSINYFKNYGISPTDNTTNIKMKNGESTVVNTVNYYNSGWPILILDNADFDSSNIDHQSVTIQLPNGNNDNPTPLIYFDKAFLIDGFPSEYSKKDKFRPLLVNNNYCEEFSFALPHVYNSIMSSYILLKYNRAYTADLVLPDPISTQIKKTDYLDALFPIEINFDYVNSKLKTKIFDEGIYLDVNKFDNYEGAFSLGINYDSGNITLFAFPTFINTEEIERRPLSLTEKFRTSGDRNYFEELNELFQSSELVKNTLNISEVEVEIINYNTSLSDIEGRFAFPDFRNIMGFAITRIQWEELITIALSSFQLKYPIYICISNKQYLKDDEEIDFTSMDLSLKGYKLIGDNINIEEVASGINLLTYGIV